MAGDWIKMRGNLWDDPRIARLCDLTEQGEAAIIGALYWLWATADQHTEDGILDGLSLRQIDRKTGVSGFAAALVEIGWIADHPEGVRIVNFTDHNGTSAKKRCTTAKRVANHRSGNADVTLEALQEEDIIVSTALAREEKRREEVNHNPPSLRDVPPQENAKPKRAKGITLTQWLADIQAKGEKPVSEHKPLWDYCAKVGIAPEWVEIAWVRFVDRYKTDEKARRKLYTDWRRVFLRAIEENWFKLWCFSDRDQAFRLTTIGVASDLATREAA